MQGVIKFRADKVRGNHLEGSRNSPLLPGQNQAFPTAPSYLLPSIAMCRASEQNYSVFGSNKSLRARDVIAHDAPPAPIPDTPTERLTTILRKPRSTLSRAAPATCTRAAMLHLFVPLAHASRRIKPAAYARRTATNLFSRRSLTHAPLPINLSLAGEALDVASGQDEYLTKMTTPASDEAKALGDVTAEILRSHSIAKPRSDDLL